MDIFTFILMVIIGTGVHGEESGRLCDPPKFIPDADQAPLVYYSPDSKQCDKFYACSFATRALTMEFLCEDGLVFDSFRCVFPHGVDCSGRELLQTPQPFGVCARQNGIFKSESSCSEYYLCTRGTGILQKCAGNLIFDDEKGVCAHPDMVPRSRSECSEEIRYKFTCPVRSGHHIYRSPDDCRAFFTCTYPSYRPHLGGCPLGKVFNEKIQRCDDPKNVPGCEKYYD